VQVDARAGVFIPSEEWEDENRLAEAAFGAWLNLGFKRNSF
jgi:hypothetical protein